MLVNCVDNFFWNYFSTMTTVNIFFFGSLPYRCKRLKTLHFARSRTTAGWCFSTTYKPPFQHPRAENLSSTVPSKKWIKLAKTFYKFMHKYFGILNPCSLSESYYFYGFFRKKVIISYHHFFIHLINTFSPLFNTSAPLMSRLRHRWNEVRTSHTKQLLPRHHSPHRLWWRAARGRLLSAPCQLLCCLLSAPWCKN